MKTKKLTTMALLCAIALTIFMIEAQIPSPFKEGALQALADKVEELLRKLKAEM